jgi:hypothetical protein
MTMKKDEVQVGKVYAMKVSGDIVPVKITGEKWSGDKHTGWVGTNTKTNRGVRIKSAQRLRGEVGGGGGGGKQERQDHEAPTPKELANTAEVEKVAKGKKPAAAKAPKPAKEPKPAKAPKPAKQVEGAKRISALDAAAQVLAASSVPMRATEMIAAMEAKGLWKSPGGKTPEATLYAAIIREIAAKGDKARFKKHERGVFVPGKGG